MTKEDRAQVRGPREELKISTQARRSEFRNSVKVEVAILGFPS